MLWCMETATRTTLNIDEELLSQLKHVAASSHRSLSAVVEDALREALAQRKHRADAPRVELPTFGGRGAHPGIDLDQSSAVLDMLDEAAGAYRPHGDRS